MTYRLKLIGRAEGNDKEIQDILKRNPKTLALLKGKAQEIKNRADSLERNQDNPMEIEVWRLDRAVRARYIVGDKSEDALFKEASRKTLHKAYRQSGGRKTTW